MRKEGMLLLYDCNVWTNARTLEATAQVTLVQFTALRHGQLQEPSRHPRTRTGSGMQVSGVLRGGCFV